MHTCKIHDLCNLVPQLWQSREAVPGLAKQRSAKIKHAAGEGFLAVRGLGISCGSRADLVQISCQPSVYSVVSSMSKSLSLLSFSLSLSLLCPPLLSINSCSTVDAVTTFWAQHRPWAWHIWIQKSAAATTEIQQDWTFHLCPSSSSQHLLSLAQPVTSLANGFAKSSLCQ